MDITTSKVNTKMDDNYNLYNEEQMNVNFIKLAKLPGCNVTPEQLNKLGEKYLNNKNTPYIM